MNKYIIAGFIGGVVLVLGLLGYLYFATSINFLDDVKEPDSTMVEEPKLDSEVLQPKVDARVNSEEIEIVTTTIETERIRVSLYLDDKLPEKYSKTMLEMESRPIYGYDLVVPANNYQDSMQRYYLGIGKERFYDLPMIPEFFSIPTSTFDSARIDIIPEFAYHSNDDKFYLYFHRYSTEMMAPYDLLPGFYVDEGGGSDKPNHHLEKKENMKFFDSSTCYQDYRLSPNRRYAICAVGQELDEIWIEEADTGLSLLLYDFETQEEEIVYTPTGGWVVSQAMEILFKFYKVYWVDNSTIVVHISQEDFLYTAGESPPEVPPPGRFVVIELLDINYK